MHEEARERLQYWFGGQAGALQRFALPISYAALAKQVGTSPEIIREVICGGDSPIYALFEHPFQARHKPSRPFALYGYDASHCGLDWETPIVAGIERWLTDHGYVALQQIGTDTDVQHLAGGGTLHTLHASMNQRDLAAHRHCPEPKDLWLFEVKGKVAGGFDFYTFAEGLGQIIEFPDELLTELLGSPAEAQGHLWKIASRLCGHWTADGRRIHLGLVVSAFRPTPVWNGGKAVMQSHGPYERPMRRLMDFVAQSGAAVAPTRYKYDRVFGTILNALERTYGFRELACGDAIVSLHVLEVAATSSGHLDLYDRLRQRSFTSEFDWSRQCKS